MNSSVFPGPKSRFAVSCSFNLKRLNSVDNSLICMQFLLTDWVSRVRFGQDPKIDSDRILGEFDIVGNRLLQVIFQTATVWGV